MIAINFIVPGNPQGKGRPRFSRNGHHTYTPKKTTDYENLIKRCYLEQSNYKIPINVPVRISILAVFSMPKNTSKANKLHMILKKIRPCKKPDGDNIEKAVLDALNGIAYEDDRQVVMCEWEKVYHEKNPGLVITIEALNYED